MNALELLKDDHKKVKRMLSDLVKLGKDGSKKQKQELLDQIEMEVKIHSELEETIFYPAFRKAAQERDEKVLFFESTEEHHVVDTVLPEVKASAGKNEEFSGRAKVLRELITHHASDEEKEMFPRATEIMGDERLNVLGQKMARRKEELQESWQGSASGAMRRAKSLADKAMPPSAKEKK